MEHWNKILIPVDQMGSSDRALDYVGLFAAAIPGMEIHLLHIFPEPPPGYYNSGASLGDYRAEKEAAAQAIFDKAAARLREAGVAVSAVGRHCVMAEHETISETILRVRAELGFGVLAVGKRGVSKAEEFLFGSISNAITRKAKGFTVWVVG